MGVDISSHLHAKNVQLIFIIESRLELDRRPRHQSVFGVGGVNVNASGAGASHGVGIMDAVVTAADASVFDNRSSVVADTGVIGCISTGVGDVWRRGNSLLHRTIRCRVRELPQDGRSASGK